MYALGCTDLGTSRSSETGAYHNRLSGVRRANELFIAQSPDAPHLVRIPSAAHVEAPAIISVGFLDRFCQGNTSPTFTRLLLVSFLDILFQVTTTWPIVAEQTSSARAFRSAPFYRAISDRPPGRSTFPPRRKQGAACIAAASTAGAAGGRFPPVLPDRKDVSRRAAGRPSGVRGPESRSAGLASSPRIPPIGLAVALDPPS